MHMSMRKIDAKGQEGIALMLALFFLFSLSAMVTVMASRVMGQHRAVSTYVNYQNCFQGLEAGIAHVKAEIFLDLNDDLDELAAELKDGRIGVSVDFVLTESVFKLTEGVPTFEDTDTVTPSHSETLPQLEYFAYSFPWGSDGIDNNGDGISDSDDPNYEDEDGYFSIVVKARMINVSRAAEIVLKADNVNVWQNAIFAGQGQGGGVINGNVSIHGSLHILGENLLPGDEAINSLALGGSSIIANSYCCGGGPGLRDELRDRVPVNETVDFMGETDLETVESVVRVKNGSVSLSGTANLGLVNDDSNNRKETLDAVYVNNNWAIVDGEGLPTNVYSDNGSAANYDLGDAVDFPTFENDQGDSHLDYYLEDFALDNSADHQIFDGDIAIKAGANDFYWNATTGDLTYTPPMGVTGLSIGMTESGAFPDAATVAALPSTDNYIWFNQATNEMVIHGRVPVSGDIQLLAGNGAMNRKITYSGVGSLLAYDGGTGRGDGDVTITTSLVTPEATTDADGNPIPTFPDNVLALMAADDLTLAGSSHLDLMGGFYAQDAIIVDKQSTIMGTIVGNTFELSQVPDVYQVIPLAQALTGDSIRMIGSDPVIVLIKVSWRELGVG